MKKPEILIYCGGNVNVNYLTRALEDDLASELQDVRFSFVGAEKIRQGGLDNPAVVGLIIPGGSRGVLVYEDLTEQGAQAIYDFVKKDNGGVLGICLGAYLLCERINYKPVFNDAPHVKTDKTIGLIPATAIGELSGISGDKKANNPWQLMNSCDIINRFGQSLKTINWRGSTAAYDKDLRKYNPRVLAFFAQTYTDITKGKYKSADYPPAVFAQDYDAGGKAIFSGMHIEILASALYEMSDNHPDKENLIKKMGSDSLRIDLLKQCIDEMLVCGKAQRFKELNAVAQP